MMEFALKSDIGQMRQLNEDYCGYFCDDDMDLALFVLADGMGGHNAGEVASKMTVDNIIKKLSSDFDSGKMKESEDTQAYMINLINLSIRYANNLVCDMAGMNRGLEGMGTTMVLLAICGRKAYIAHIGDSRAYIIDGLHITQLTTDHSYIEELIREGSISREEARLHPKRNQITRAIGVNDTVRPDFITIDIKEGNTFLLCSDGLSGILEDEEIRVIVSDAETAEEASKKLLNEANSRGGYDNVSVVIVKIFE